MRILCVFLVGMGVFAGSSQWRGPNRDGHYPNQGLMSSWPEQGPELKLRVSDLFPGYGAPTVDQSQVFLTGTDDQKEYLMCLNLKGEMVWKKEMGASYPGDFPLARCTPTVTNGHVYVISSAGQVSCFDVKGNQIWSVDGHKQFQGSWGIWGTSENPLVFDGKVIYTPGGDQTTMVALDSKTGKTVWQTTSLKDKSAYASPIVFKHAGRDVIASVSATYIFGVDASNGEVLWKYSYGTLDAPPVEWGAPFVNTISPIYYNGSIYTTSGYNHVGAKFNLAADGKGIDVAWTDATLDTHHGGVVLVKGHIFGANWINNRSGNWCSINWETGKPAFETKWHTKGSIVAAGDFLILYEESSGHVGLAKANPKNLSWLALLKFQEVPVRIGLIRSLPRASSSFVTEPI